MQKEAPGEAAERWIKEFAVDCRLLSKKEFSLGQVVKLFNTKLQLRMTSARLHIDKFFPFANDWIDLTLSDRRLPDRSSKQLQVELSHKLLDLVMATDVVLSIRDNQGIENLISVDVTSAPAKSKGKLNTIQGKREDGEPTKFNRNRNLPAVRNELGIDKHLVLVINPNHPPEHQVLLSELYAFTNQQTKTGMINLHYQAQQVTLSNQVSVSPQSASKMQLDPNLAKVLALIERLPDKELTNTVQRVQNYFANIPPQPPPLAEQLAVQQEIKKLLPQIQSLWQRQERQVAVVEGMQKNPLRAWDKKYDAAMTELQQTMKQIKEAIGQKDQKESQLKEWAQTDKVYQAWLNDPQTRQMQDVAAVLKMPQIQQRVNLIHAKTIRQQQKKTKLEAKQQHSIRDRKPGGGLGL